MKKTADLAGAKDANHAHDTKDTNDTAPAGEGMSPDDPPECLVFLDGECVLCHRVGAWLCRRDTQGVLVFTAIQSPAAEVFLRRRGQYSVSSVLFWQDGELATSSEAAWRILKVLPWPWSWFGWVLKWVPFNVREIIYIWISKRRGLFFGINKGCELSPSLPRFRIWGTLPE